MQGAPETAQAGASEEMPGRVGVLRTPCRVGQGQLDGEAWVGRQMRGGAPTQRD